MFLTGDFNTPSHEDYTEATVTAKASTDRSPGRRRRPWSRQASTTPIESGLPGPRDGARHHQGQPDFRKGGFGRIDYVFAGGPVTTLDSNSWVNGAEPTWIVPSSPGPPTTGPCCRHSSSHRSPCRPRSRSLGVCSQRANSSRPTRTRPVTIRSSWRSSRRVLHCPGRSRPPPRNRRGGGVGDDNPRAGWIRGRDARYRGERDRLNAFWVRSPGRHRALHGQGHLRDRRTDHGDVGRRSGQPMGLDRLLRSLSRRPQGR